MIADQDGLAPGHRAPDVTAQGQAGIDNRESDIYFSAIETTRMPMILTDPQQPDNPIVFANHAFLAMTGYTAEEIVGHNCRFLQGLETDPETVRQVREAVHAGREATVEILNYRKDGSSFWNALYISPVHNPRGDLVYFFASQLDVSRRRDAEDALRQSQKMEAVGQLTGGIAHDFNNLLQVVLGSLELLQRREAVRSDPRALRLLSSADEAAARAKTLTQQLLAFSRKQKLDGRVVSLNQLIEGMSDLTISAIGDQNITLATKFADDLWPTRIDPTQAETALLNICLNARDAMPNGGTITLETRNVELDPGDGILFDSLTPGRYVAVAVTDTGGGIAAAHINRVMDPFYTTKEEGKGTGLGLSMVWGFAKQSGGAARIYSEEGVGTTVRLYFPATADQAKPLAGAGTRASERGGSERILVVDDRRDVAELACLILEEAGYTTVIAENAREALDLMGTEPSFDMLFSDLIMPGGMNGVNLARAVKGRFPRMKVLLTTGYAETAIERTDAGGVEFEMINKPYTRGDLIRKIRIVMDGPTGVG